jgi:hypothetical protein
MPSNRGLGYLHFRHLCSDPAPDAMRGVPLLPWRFLIRFQKRIDERHHRSELWSLSHRCLSFYRNCPQHSLTDHASMNPQLLGDPSNRSITMLILTSNLLE